MKMEPGGRKWGVCVFAAGSSKALADRKIRKSTMLGAPTELEALLLAFGSTIGTYLLTKDEGQTPSELRERWL